MSDEPAPVHVRDLVTVLTACDDTNVTVLSCSTDAPNNVVYLRVDSITSLTHLWFRFCDVDTPGPVHDTSTSAGTVVYRLVTTVGKTTFRMVYEGRTGAGEARA